MIPSLAVSSLFFTLALSTHSSYTLEDSYTGHDFYEQWKWETFDDPTHGRVNYVDQTTAMERNLSYITPDNAFVMKADSTSKVPPGSRGRDSIRITSLKAYDRALFVADISHMPVGCGTWPAFWTLSQKGPWPNGGEIDIIEGVHGNTLNLASLHTTPQCSMDKNACGDRASLQTGHAISTDCNTAVNFNQGCGVEFAKPNSYGKGFNQNNGGYYILEKGSPIRVWFLPRDDPKIKELFECEDPSKTISTNDLPPVPDAIFPTKENCKYASHFDAHAMVFDLTFCGDWAGATFTSAGCGPSCLDFVDNNPEAFSEAYWAVNSVKVYTRDDDSASDSDTAQALLTHGTDL